MTAPATFADLQAQLDAIETDKGYIEYRAVDDWWPDDAIDICLIENAPKSPPMQIPPEIMDMVAAMGKRFAELRNVNPGN